MTKHFKLSVGLLALLSLLLFGLYRYVAMRIREVIPSRTSSVLSKNDKEVVTFNEKTHTLTVQTQTKTITEYAKNPTVEIRKDGSVVVLRHLTGFELEPFLGGGYADTGRLFIGANVLHFSRFDLSTALGWSPDNRHAAVQPFLAVGYNFYNNTSINVAVNPVSALTNKGIEIGGFVSVRL